MQPRLISEIDPNINRVRCLVWTRCRVGFETSWERHTWLTDWKWCIAAFDKRYSGFPSDPREPRAWYIIGIHDQNGMTIRDVEITHYCDLPDDMGPAR